MPMIVFYSWRSQTAVSHSWRSQTAVSHNWMSQTAVSFNDDLLFIVTFWDYCTILRNLYMVYEAVCIGLCFGLMILPEVAKLEQKNVYILSSMYEICILSSFNPVSVRFWMSSCIIYTTGSP